MRTELSKRYRIQVFIISIAWGALLIIEVFTPCAGVIGEAIDVFCDRVVPSDELSMFLCPLRTMRTN